MTKFLNISTDSTLGGASPADDVVSSQKAIKEYVDNIGMGANTDLSNLTDAGKNIANWSSNIKNCIVEVPQNIKLELNNGTLILKAGSKVYVPNGAGVFDVRVITQDKTNSFSWMTTGTYLLTYFTDSNTIDAAYVNACYSGTSFPTPVNLGAVCYRTDENKVYRFDGSNWYNVLALPLALISSTGSGVSSIDQVFNGFGYIGSTKFVLPGVVGLVPNGKNSDGTLNNTKITVSNVLTLTGASYDQTVTGTFDSASILNVHTGNLYYNPDLNLLFYQGAVFNKVPFTNNYIQVGGKIDSRIRFFQPFVAVDYNEFNNHRVIDYQAPTAENNYTWYRKYSDGWVEQGGDVSKPNSSSVGVILAVPMEDSHYKIQVTDRFAGNMATAPSVGNETTTGFTIYQGNGGAIVCIWEVKGTMAK